jgi:rRNA maturation endonuclease Nob1
MGKGVLVCSDCGKVVNDPRSKKDSCSECGGRLRGK